MSEAKGETIRVTIDGHPFDGEKGKTILDVARQHGIVIPTLCFHPGIEAIGACRLCVVEITKPDWGGWKKIVTSCLYPIEDNLIIDTKSDKIRENRKAVLELLLARVPNSDVIRKLADEYGIYETSYTRRENADNCILCGICVRVCDAIGRSAITFLSRGPDKYVDMPEPDACIGCLACALNCPTGAIPFEEADNKRRIWGREFDLVGCWGSGEPIGTPQQIEHFAKRSGLPIESFLKSAKVREKEAAAVAVGVKL